MSRKQKKQIKSAQTEISAVGAKHITVLNCAPLGDAERDVRAPFGAPLLIVAKFILLAFLLPGLTLTVARAQKNADNLLAGFEKSLAQGKFAEIEHPLLDYAIAHPNDAQALSLLAELRHRQNRLQEAKGLYQRVLTLNPNLISAKINFGRLTFELGQAENARLILNEINPVSPVAPRDQLNLAAALLLVGEFQKAVNLAENLPPKLRDNEALPVIAAGQLALGNRDKLRELIPLLKRASVGKPETAVRSAEILQNAGMTAETLDLLRAALAAAPNDVGILVLLGRMEVFAQEFAQAKLLLNRAARLAADSAEVAAAQALLANAQGETTTALALLSKARERAPDSSAIASAYILTAIRANQAQQAVDAAQKLLASKPSEPEFLYLFGAASLQNGNINAAQQALERFVRERPTDSRGCLALGLTLATRRAGFEAARRQLAHCLEIDPKNFEAKYQLGLSYKTQGENAKAVSLLEEVVGQAPNYAAALRDLGALYLQTGAEKQARQALERAVALDAQDADTHFQLSRLYNLTGDTALAKQQLEIFQKLKNTGAKSTQ